MASRPLGWLLLAECTLSAQVLCALLPSMAGKLLQPTLTPRLTPPPALTNSAGRFVSCSGSEDCDISPWLYPQDQCAQHKNDTGVIWELGGSFTLWQGVWPCDGHLGSGSSLSPWGGSEDRGSVPVLYSWGGVSRTKVARGQAS